MVGQWRARPRRGRGVAPFARMAGDEDDAVGVVAVGQRHADRRRRGEAGGDAVDDLDLEPERAQVRGFLAAAAEHERVAALEPHDALAAQRLGRHQPLDEGLRRARAAAALADLDDARRAARVAQHAVADEVVDEQHGGLADRADRLDGQQLRVARAGADQVDDGDGWRSRRHGIAAGGEALGGDRGGRRRVPGRGGALRAGTSRSWCRTSARPGRSAAARRSRPHRRRRAARAATISRSLTSKQLQTWRPRGAIAHRRVAPGDEQRAAVGRGRAAPPAATAGSTLRRRCRRRAGSRRAASTSALPDRRIVRRWPRRASA